MQLKEEISTICLVRLHDIVGHKLCQRRTRSRRRYVEYSMIANETEHVTEE